MPYRKKEDWDPRRFASRREDPYEDYGWEYGQSGLPEFRDRSAHMRQDEMRRMEGGERRLRQGQSGGEYEGPIDRPRSSSYRYGGGQSEYREGPSDDYGWEFARPGMPEFYDRPIHRRTGSRRQEWEDERPDSRQEDRWRGRGGEYGEGETYQPMRGERWRQDYETRWGPQEERWGPQGERWQRQEDRWRGLGGESSLEDERRYREDERAYRGGQGWGREAGGRAAPRRESGRSAVDSEILGEPYGREYSPAGYYVDVHGRGFDDEGHFSIYGDWATPGPYTGYGPSGYRRSDNRIFEDVCQRLTDHGQVDASDIEIEVQDGEVTLTGSVEDRRTKRMAEDVASSVPGVQDVHNRLTFQHGSRAERGPERPTETRAQAAPDPSGAGRIDRVGPSGVYPASGPMPEGGAEVQDMASWGQGERGAQGYLDHGESELRPPGTTEEQGE